jgi:hypothetical protein
MHEAVSVVQEGIHSIKPRKLRAMVVKVDISKAYYKVSWLQLRLMLIHLGFYVPFLNWIMNCITSVTSFL